MTDKNKNSSAGLSAGNIAHIKLEFMKLPSETRRQIMIVANSLNDGNDDEELIHSVVWYFSQKKNAKQLEKVFEDITNSGVFPFKGDLVGESPAGDSSVPSKVKILYPEA